MKAPACMITPLKRHRGEHGVLASFGVLVVATALVMATHPKPRVSDPPVATKPTPTKTEPPPTVAAGPLRLNGCHRRLICVGRH